MSNANPTACLKRLTKEQLVRLAYSEGCGESSFLTEWRGPARKEIVIAAIIARRKFIADVKAAAPINPSSTSEV